ncbi:hypothetical protein D3C75_1371700 [compost metagenome]
MICVAYADAAKRGSPAIKMSTTINTPTITIMITTMNMTISTTIIMLMTRITIMTTSRVRRAP